MILRNLFLFSITQIISPLLVSQAWANEFRFVSETCSVVSEQQLQFTTPNFELSSRVKLELFFTNEEKMPKIRLQFLEHAPQQAHILWSSILQQRNNTDLFSEDIRASVLAEDSLPFEMSQVSAAGQMPTFETPLFEALRSQNMIALFLTQDQLSVRVATDQGLIWTAPLSLKDSDTSFKSMALACFKEKTMTYLSANGEILPQENSTNSTAIAVSRGYGLTAFSIMTALLPQNVPPEVVIGPATPQSGELWQLLEEKKTKLQEYSVALNDSDFKKFTLDLDRVLSEKKKIDARLLEISGSSSGTPGLIPSLEQNIQTSLQQIAQLQLELSTTLREQSALREKLAELETTLKPLAPELIRFTEILKALDTQQASIASLKEKVDRDIADLEAILKQKASDLARSETESTPWSLDQLEARKLQVLNQQKQYSQLQSLLAIIPDIQQKINHLLAAAETVRQSSKDYLLKIATHQKHRSQIQTLSNLIQKGEEVPSIAFVDEFSFASLNQDVESRVAVSRVVREYDAEFGIHESLYNNLQSNLTQTVSELNAQGAKIFSSLLCDSNILLDPTLKKQPCLFVDELLDETAHELFVNNLPPALLNTMLGNIEEPWPQGLSKPQIIISQLRSEIATFGLNQVLASQWLRLRHIVWRWATLQNESESLMVCEDLESRALLSDGIFSAKYYETVFHCEKTNFENLKKQKSEALVALLDAAIVAEDSEQKLGVIEDNFVSDKDKFASELSLALRESQDYSTLAQVYSECLLPLTSINKCDETVKLEIEKSNAFVVLAQELLLNFSIKLTELDGQAVKTQRDIADLTSQQLQFKTANNIDGLLIAIDETKRSLEGYEGKISASQLVISQNSETVRRLSEQKDQLILEQNKGIAELVRLTLQETQISSDSKMFCEKILAIKSDLQNIHLRIYQLLGVESSPESKDGVCEAL